MIKCPVFCCSLKMECEKLAQEKTEMQRHYVMVSATERDQWMPPGVTRWLSAELFIAHSASSLLQPPWSDLCPGLMWGVSRACNKLLSLAVAVA